MNESLEPICKNIYELINKLNEKYPNDNIKEADKIIDSILRNDQRYNLQVELNKLQEVINKLYKNYGVVDEIILLQAEVNNIRFMYDLPDEKELIYNHSDGTFAQ